jgi:hypothetical protein
MKIFSLLIAIFILIFAACQPYAKEKVTVKGYKPIYQDKNSVHTILSTPAKVLENPGKIYIKDRYIFVNEKGKGVHIIDNQNPALPVKISFIQIPGNKDIAIKGNIMYVDNFTDLVSLDIRDVSNIKITKRVNNVFPVNTFMYPEEYYGYFECVDTTKGYVTGWVETDLVDPKCYR